MSSTNVTGHMKSAPSTRERTAKMTDTLWAGSSLVVGDPLDRLTSNNDRFSVVMQSDGNLVVYFNPRSRAVWASNSSGSGATSADLQDDGNFVLYRSDDVPVWASHTDGQGAGLSTRDAG